MNVEDFTKWSKRAYSAVDCTITDSELFIRVYDDDFVVPPTKAMLTIVVHRGDVVYDNSVMVDMCRVDRETLDARLIWLISGMAKNLAHIELKG